MTWIMSNLVLVHLKALLVLEEYRWTACAKRTIGSESFWTHKIVLLGDES
jgi:hypothetical protein